VVRVALHEVLEFAHAGRPQPGDDSRPAEADREHLLAFALADRRHLANANAMFANSRLSDWC
jgi:hypothetical protein